MTNPKFQLRRIWVRTSFIGWHRYPNAPDEVSYLRDLHRHTFNVKVSMTVRHEVDRDVEFHMFKKVIDLICDCLDKSELGSCESMCDTIHATLTSMPNYRNFDGTISVDEDGECGSTLLVH